MYGANDDSGKILLQKSESHKDKFERGRTDVFKIEAADLGPIRKVLIGHDNSTSNVARENGTLRVVGVSGTALSERRCFRYTSVGYYPLSILFSYEFNV